MSQERLNGRPLRREELTDQLRKLVESARGDRIVRIDAERDLADRFDVSRLTLRSAIKILEQEGMIVRKQGSGTYILPRPAFEVVHVLSAPDLKPQDPFYSEFVTALTHRASNEKIQLRMISPSEKPEVADGTPLILIGKLDNGHIQDLKKLYRCIVSTQNYPDSLNLTQVYFDDYEIGHHAATILAEHGHSRLLHLAGPAKYPSALQRLRGFVAGAEDSHASAKVLNTKMNWSGGYQLGDEVAKMLHDNNEITAVFAANDWMALGLIQRLSEVDITVPKDVSVIGCDDIHLASEIIPHLSTFRWDMSYLISEVFSTIRSLLFSETSVSKRMTLPASFLERDTLRRLEQ